MRAWAHAPDSLLHFQLSLPPLISQLVYDTHLSDPKNFNGCERWQGVREPVASR
jgi:hypothetical protein